MCTVVVNVCICEMLMLMCIEHTSTTLPDNEIWDYHYYLEVKGNYQVWSIRDDVYRIESPEAKKCVQFAVMYMYMWIAHSHVILYNTTQPHCQLMKFKITIINIELKVTIKFILSFRDDMCRIERLKATKCVQFVFEMLTLLCIEHTGLNHVTH